MGLVRLGIENFRCIAAADLSLQSGRNFLIGPNGAGKTSFLEAVYLLGRGRSFRSRQTRSLVRHGAEGLSVYGEVVRPGEPVRRLGVGWQGGKLEIRLDGAPADSIASLARTLPVHVIDPRLHYLVEAGPSERRRFVDAGVFHVEPGYLAQWRNYRRALGQRNAALKRRANAESEAWTEPLLEAGEAVDVFRRSYCEGLGTMVRAIGERLIGRAIEIRYQRGWREGMSLRDALGRSAERDRATGTTQVGPHRADLTLAFDVGAIRDVASRGQQKLVAAALVLGQLGELKRETGLHGTLLLDDPAAELDDTSLGRLLEEIQRLDTQCLITGLRLDVLRRQSSEPVFHVEQGQIKPMLY